jgi:hypothetical protein
MTDYDDDPGKPDQDITLQQTLIEMHQNVFPYPVRARTKERDGFIRNAHSCLAVRIEDFSEKHLYSQTEVGLLANLVYYCLDQEYDADTIHRLCSDFKGARSAYDGGILNKRKFMYFDNKTYIHSMPKRDARPSRTRWRVAP